MHSPEHVFIPPYRRYMLLTLLAFSASYYAVWMNLPRVIKVLRASIRGICKLTVKDAMGLIYIRAPAVFPVSASSSTVPLLNVPRAPVGRVWVYYAAAG